MLSINKENSIDIVIYALENWNESLKTAKITHEFLIPKFKEKGIFLDDYISKRLFLLNGIYKKIVVILLNKLTEVHQLMMEIRKYKLEVLVSGVLNLNHYPMWFPDQKLLNKFLNAFDKLVSHLLWSHNSEVAREKIKCTFQIFECNPNISIFPNEEIKTKFILLSPKDKETILQAIKYLKLTKESFNQTEINKLYRIEALKYHPDKGGDPNTFKLIVSYKEALNKLF